MRAPVCPMLCTSILLLPCVIWAQNHYESTEPQYHWPEYPPFSPGSWAWPTAGWWEFPAFYQNYGLAQAPVPVSPPQVIIVFAPVTTSPVQPNQNIATNRPSASGRDVITPNMPTAPNAQQESPLYLIALKEGVIRPVVSYRVEGAVLRYTDLDGAPRQVPLDRVDRALSAELNRRRRVEFRLPPEQRRPQMSTGVPTPASSHSKFPRVQPRRRVREE